MSARQAVLTEVLTRLDAIAAGVTYDTTPVIHETQAAAFGSTDTVSIWVEYGDEIPDRENWSFPRGGAVALEVVINILVRSDGTALTTLANKALTDVRNAINASVENWHATTGAYLQGFDSCTTDEGALSYEGMILFSQPVVFTYHAGPTW